MKPGNFNDVVLGQLPGQFVSQQFKDLGGREIQLYLCFHGAGQKKDKEASCGPPLDVPNLFSHHLATLLEYHYSPF